MKYSRFKPILILIPVLITTLACGLFTPGAPQPAETLNALYTAAADTLEAMSTEGIVTLTGQPSPTVALSFPTASPVIFETFTPVPPLGPITQCDAASFVTDVTYPDGSVVGRGSQFTKIWRLKNVGTCTWTTSYALVYVSGEKFGAQTAVSLTTSILPGQTVDLPLGLTAPNQNGRYKGYWLLRNASGTLFGTGASANSSIYVDINVSGYTVTGYDFTANYCDANWNNGSKSLPCPGNEGDDRGFVLLLNSPLLEDGKSQGKGLLTYPEKKNNGLVTGKFPGVNIQTGDHLQALIGCEYKANDCNMIFKLEYQIGGGPVRLLGQWQEVYEGKYFPINIDLSSLSGQKVRFIFTVLANGTSHEDFALWITPRITRQSSQPPTAVFTTTSSPTVTATATATLTPTDTPTETPTETPTDTPVP